MTSDGRCDTVRRCDSRGRGECRGLSEMLVDDHPHMHTGAGKMEPGQKEFNQKSMFPLLYTLLSCVLIHCNTLMHSLQRRLVENQPVFDRSFTSEMVSRQLN